MSYKTPCITLFTVLVATAIAQSAEIRLRSEAQCAHTLVMLADVADVIPAVGDDALQLGQTVLLTAPARGEEKTISAVEIRDILSRSGVSSMQNQLTGASKVTLVGPAFTARGSYEENGEASSFIRNAAYTYQTQPTQNSLTPSATHIQPAAATINTPRQNTLRKPVSAPLLRTLEQQLGEAICVYLNYRQATETGKASNLPWQVALKLSQEQGKLLASSGQIVDIMSHAVAGNASYAMTGPQRFGIRMQGLDETTGQHVVVTVDAQVDLPQEVVVVKRALPKGFIISAQDVMLQRVDKLKGEEFFVDVTEVIGQETVRAIDETTALTPSLLRRPMMVKKGDIVTIRAKSTGIEVRSQVTALADGCKGDMIMVETIDPNRNKRTRNRTAGTDTFLARVCGPKNVEVFATGNIVN